MAVYVGKLIVEGRHYDWLPSDIGKAPEFGVRKQLLPTLDGKNITVVQSAPPSSTDTYIEKRKVHRQGWVMNWSESAPMDLFMRDHFETVYTLQKEVWVQFDDEMTRDGCILETVGTEYKAYFTPTYPIMPYGSAPDDVREYNGTVFVNNVPQYTGFTIDSEIGMVRFATALTSTDVVQMAYTWRARCRIDQCDIRPGFQLARHLYVGSIMLVQSIPNYTIDPWPITMPWDHNDITSPTLADRLGNSIGTGSGSSGSTQNSHATLLGKDTRYA